MDSEPNELEGLNDKEGLVESSFDGVSIQNLVE
jgi:hypothetical protein